MRDAKLALTTSFRGDMAGRTGMVLGLDFMRSHRIMVARTQHLLYLTYFRWTAL